MVAFTPIVQVDLSGTAFGGAPTWTDVTRFARLKASPITINKWRQDELSDVAPAVMTVVLDNDDVPGDVTAPNAGRFTPFLTTSPFYPRILPGARIRAGVTISATTYWRFDGYVDSWDAAYDNGEFGICTVVANDMLARLGDADLLRAPYLEEVLLDAPTVFYPCSEAQGVTSVGDISGHGGAPLVVRSAQAGPGDVVLGATSLVADGATSAHMNSSLSAAAGDDFKGSWLQGQAPSKPTSSATGTFEAWIQLDPAMKTVLDRNLPTIAQPTPICGFVVQSGGVTAYFGIALYGDSSAGNPVELASVFGVGSQSHETGVDLADGKPHHVVLATNTFYVDGVSLGAFAASPYAVNSSTDSFVVGGAPTLAWLGANYQVSPLRGFVQYAAFYNATLSAARVAAHYAAGLNMFAGEGSAARVARLLSYRTNLGSTLDAGQGAIAGYDFAGSTIQQTLLDTAKAEGGVIYVDSSTGKIVLLDRKRLRDPVVAVNLDITAQQTGPDLDFRADRLQLRNDITITRTGGPAQRLIDATSKSTYGTKAMSDTYATATDADTLGAVGWLLANEKDIRQRTPALSVDLLAEPTAGVATAVLSLAPLQRVSLLNPPASAPTTDVLIQGCTDTIGVDVLTCQFFVSPLPRPTLRFDAAADAFTKLDAGNVFAW